MQGFAGAVMLPQVFGLIRDLFAPEEMGKAFGVYGPVMGLAAMLGPIVSGGLISADVLGTGWRMIFLVNLPIGAFTLLAGARYLPSVAPECPRRARLDCAGVALAGAGMFLLVFPLVQGHELGWPLWMVGMLVASVPVLAGFALHLLRLTRAGGVPLIEPGIFKRRAYTAGVVFSLVFIGSLAGIVLIFNVFLQAGLGFTPWHSAITTAPWALGAFVGSAVGGITMATLGRRVLHAGLVIEAVGLAGAVRGPAGGRRARGFAGPAGADDRRRGRHGDGVRAAVRHRDGRRRAARDRVGVGRPAGGRTRSACRSASRRSARSSSASPATVTSTAS